VHSEHMGLHMSDPTLLINTPPGATLGTPGEASAWGLRCLSPRGGRGVSGWGWQGLPRT